MDALPSRTKALQASVDRYRDPFALSWRTLWQWEKLTVCFEAAQRRGGLAFTLQFSNRVEDQVGQQVDPARYLRRRIDREVRATFGHLPPYGFGFDVSPHTGRLHAHGVILAPDDSPEGRKTLRGALCRAGGLIKGKASGTQFDIRAMTDGLGWAHYSVKAFDLACGLTGTNKVTFVSTDLKKIAKALHAQGMQTITR